jgi:DNA-binding Xre family transcriptional regulator
MRGLPEMAVKNINLSNLILQAYKGAELIEADGISMKNVQLLDTKTKAIVSIDNSKNITIDNLQFGNGADAVMSISGEKSSNIKLLNTDASKAKEKIEYKDGASEKALAVK